MSFHLPKYFNPAAYWTMLISVSARVILSIGIPLRVRSSVGEYSNVFIANSFLEYHLRARQGYKREPITVDWILGMIEQDDIVLDVGANVGTYSFNGLR